MKFLCPNCKAKYQIADEKIGGRTLKMDCRRCQHTIVLRGDQPQGDASGAEAAKPGAAAAKSSASRHGALAPPASPGPAARRSGSSSSSRGGSSHVGPAPARPAQRSALSADFRRNAAPAAPEAPARATPLDQWHVAINDVPVGPMRRDEISRKISTGAVHQDSLAWREGFDDWRPLREIPELAALLRRSEAARTSEVPRPPSARIPTAGARSMQASGSRPGAARPGAPGSRSAPAAARSNVVAIGGRLGASAAPAIEEDQPLDELDGEPTRVASTLEEVAAADFAAAKREEPAKASGARSAPPPAAAPLPAAERISVLPDPFAAPPPASLPHTGTSSHGVAVAVAPAPARPARSLPVGAWIGIVGAMAFGVTMAVLIAPRLLGAPTPPPTLAPAVATTIASPPAGPVEARVDVAPAAPPSAEARASAETTPAEHPSAEPAATHGTGGAHASKAPARGGPAATAGGPGPATGAQAATKQVSARFAAFADDGAGAAPIDTRATPTGAHATERSATGSGDLSADQIRNVVSRGQRELQRCWELEIRGMRDVQTTRMDVDITIGASGTVTRASARGVGIGNLSECIERNVRRWHFPPSGDETQTSFPVVFTGV